MMEAQATREKLVEDFSAVIADSEAILKAMASAGGEKAHALRADLEHKLQDARERLARIEAGAVARTKQIAKHTDDYVRANPWQSIAVAASIGTVVGILLGFAISRNN